MGSLNGKVAWVTGAGSGIGEAAALALAAEGASLVLTGRRLDKLDDVVARIVAAGGTAIARPGDVTKPDAVQAIADAIAADHGRIDILVNNAGLNIPDRHWSDLTPAGVDILVQGNLSSAFYCVVAVLPIMRAQHDGVLIHTSSMAGRFIGGVGGPGYTAAKHGVVAMSHSINMEECVHGIRSSVVLPGEAATEIMLKRAVPMTSEELSRMLQSFDVGDLIRYIACLPSHVCINEVMITPTWNRAYVAALQRRPAAGAANVAEPAPAIGGEVAQAL